MLGRDVGWLEGWLVGSPLGWELGWLDGDEDGCVVGREVLGMLVG